MTTLADRTIAALRGTHDQVAAHMRGLGEDQLQDASGADGWPVAQVLSHLGSGTEIALATYRAALDGTEPPGDGFNQGIWDRWNALAPAEQASGFLAHEAALVETLEALTPEQRERTDVQLGFLPAPIPLATALGMRLNEAALHGWDVRVGAEPTATVHEGAARVVVEHLSNGLGFMLGYIGKADALPEPSRVRLADAGAALVIDERVSLVPDDEEPTATLVAEPEAVLRLVAGRLGPAHTPAGVEVSGNVSLDDLRRVFPGY